MGIGSAASGSCGKGRCGSARTGSTGVGGAGGFLANPVLLRGAIGANTPLAGCPPDGRPAGKAILGEIVKRRRWYSITGSGTFDSNCADYVFQRLTIARGNR